MGSFCKISTFAVAIVIIASCAQKPRQIVISPDNAVFHEKGEIITFKGTVLDTKGKPIANQAVIWYSSDHNVAVADNGVVRVVGSGEATISAMVGNVIGTAKVRGTIVSSIIVTPEKLSMKLGETIPLTATIKDDKGNTVTNMIPIWESENADIASVNEKGEVTLLAKGSTNIKATIGKISGSAVVQMKQMSNKPKIAPAATPSEQQNNKSNWMDKVKDWFKGTGKDMFNDGLKKGIQKKK